MNESSVLESVRSAFERTFRYLPSEAWKSRLYLVTLLAQAPAVLARGFLAFCTVGVAGWFTNTLVGPTPAAWLVGLAPLLWSASSFWIPGGGWWWHRYQGAREASELERKKILDVVAHLGSKAEDAGEYLRVYIYDSQKFVAFSRGRTLLISVGLLESKFLKPAIAHELGHLRGVDARLIQALDRLVVGDPFPVKDEKQAREPAMSWVIALRRWFFRMAGGQPFLNFPPLRAAWADFLRKGEERADEFAAELGQGMALVRYLKAYEQQRDQPNPRLLFNYREHIPVAQRIANLTAMHSAQFSNRRRG